MIKHFFSQIFWKPEIIAETKLIADDFEIERERNVFKAMMAVH